MTNIYRPPPTLKRFMRSDAFCPGIVGPVGSAKSSTCVMEILRRSTEQEPHTDGVRRTRWVIVRNTYPELRDTTRKTFEQWIPDRLGVWHEREFSFEMRFQLPDGTKVHSEVLFRALDRPGDIKKLLSLELTGAYINEARTVPREVFDVLQTRLGRFPSKIQGGPSWFGMWFDTNPWHVGHWGYRLFTTKPDGFELYKQPGGRSKHAENVENLPAGYYQRLTAGKDAEWIAEYVDGEYPKADRGSIYGALIEAMSERGQLAPFEIGDGVAQSLISAFVNNEAVTAQQVSNVFTSWDLGISDATSIWWFRPNALGGIDVLDHYEAHGEALSHYFAVLLQRSATHGYQYAKHVLPHDARARSLQTGRSVEDQFVDRFSRAHVAIGPSLSVVDGIAAARLLLEDERTRIHPRCSVKAHPNDVDGVEALREYKYEYDDTHKVYTRKPLHDWASHTADSFRGVAVYATEAELLSKAPEKAEAKPYARSMSSFNLEELWPTAPQGSRRIT